MDRYDSGAIDVYFLRLVVLRRGKGIGANFKSERLMDSNLEGVSGDMIWYGVRGWIIIYHHQQSSGHGWPRWRRLLEAVESIHQLLSSLLFQGLLATMPPTYRAAHLFR